jgi:hypothetical protein
MIEKDVLLEDTFVWKDVPFIVEVTDIDRFINKNTGETRGVNVNGAPSGFRSTPFGWVRTPCRVAKVRPDYPYESSDKWSDNIDQHAHIVEPHEIPRSKWIIFTEVEDNEPRDPKSMAEDAIAQIKEQYHEQKPITL